MVRSMIALSVDSAKNLAIGLAILFLVLSIVSALIVKKIVTKIILVVLLAGLALGAYTQRASLKDCVEKGQQEIESGTAGVGSITCTFFGTDIEVPAP
jgi:high-affinity Fe2+/Pb2+ permease